MWSDQLPASSNASAMARGKLAQLLRLLPESCTAISRIDQIVCTQSHIAEHTTGTPTAFGCSRLANLELPSKYLRLTFSPSRALRTFRSTKSVSHRRWLKWLIKAIELFWAIDLTAQSNGEWCECTTTKSLKWTFWNGIPNELGNENLSEWT